MVLFQVGPPISTILLFDSSPEDITGPRHAMVMEDSLVACKPSIGPVLLSDIKNPKRLLWRLLEVKEELLTRLLIMQSLRGLLVGFGPSWTSYLTCHLSFGACYIGRAIYLCSAGFTCRLQMSHYLNHQRNSSLDQSKTKILLTSS